MVRFCAAFHLAVSLSVLSFDHDPRLPDYVYAALVDIKAPNSIDVVLNSWGFWH